MAADEPVKTGEPVETPKPILSSLIPLSIFLLSWLFSLAVFPVAAYLSIGHGVHYVTYGLLFYYTYRMFFKLKRFDYVVRAMSVRAVPEVTNQLALRCIVQCA